MSVLKNTIKEIGHRASLMMWWAKLTPFMPVLAPSTRVFSSLHSVFCSGWKQGILN